MNFRSAGSKERMRAAMANNESTSEHTDDFYEEGLVFHKETLFSNRLEF